MILLILPAMEVHSVAVVVRILRVLVGDAGTGLWEVLESAESQFPWAKDC